MEPYIQPSHHYQARMIGQQLTVGALIVGMNAVVAPVSWMRLSSHREKRARHPPPQFGHFPGGVLAVSFRRIPGRCAASACGDYDAGSAVSLQ